MSKKANPTAVGAFVIGAAVLAVACLLIFGAGKMFVKKHYFMMFFEDPISGLAVGAPVEFRGVRVGSVYDISVVANMTNDTVQLPVVLEIDPGSIRYVGGSLKELTKHDSKALEQDIERGLKGQLVAQSMLTGRLKIQIDYHPNAKGYVEKNTFNKYEVIPSMQSPLAQMLKKFEKMPLSEIAWDTHRAMSGLAELITSESTKTMVKEAGVAVGSVSRVLSVPGATNLVTHLNAVLEEVDITLSRINTNIAPLSGQAGVALDNMGATLAELRATIAIVNAQLEPFMKSLTGTSDQLAAAMDERSPVRYDLDQMMKSFTRAASAVADLADYLERHPEALIRGKEGK